MRATHRALERPFPVTHQDSEGERFGEDHVAVEGDVELRAHQRGDADFQEHLDAIADAAGLPRRRLGRGGAKGGDGGGEGATLTHHVEVEVGGVDGARGEAPPVELAVGDDDEERANRSVAPKERSHARQKRHGARAVVRIRVRHEHESDGVAIGWRGRRSTDDTSVDGRDGGGDEYHS